MRMKIRKKTLTHYSNAKMLLRTRDPYILILKLKKKKNARAQIILFAEYIHSSLF